MGSKATAASKRLSVRVKFNLTAEEADRLVAEAKASGLGKAKYVRRTMTKVWQMTPPPKPPRKADTEALERLANAVGHLKKVGSNVNQLAHQANTGMVPVQRAEIIYAFNQIQVVLSQLAAAAEGLRA